MYNPLWHKAASQKPDVIKNQKRIGIKVLYLDDERVPSISAVVRQVVYLKPERIQS
jgi:hypothetical protein